MNPNDSNIYNAIEYINNLNSNEKLVIYEDNLLNSLPNQKNSKNLDSNRKVLQSLSANKSVLNESIANIPEQEVKIIRAQRKRSNRHINKENIAPTNNRTLRSSKRLKKFVGLREEQDSINDDVFENTKPNDSEKKVYLDENNNILNENNKSCGQEAKEQEVISFLTDLKNERIKIEQNSSLIETPIKNPRKLLLRNPNQVLTDKSINMLMSPIPKCAPTTSYDINEFQNISNKSSSPLLLKQLSPESNRSVEISLHVYDKNNVIKVPREPIKHLKTPIVFETNEGPLEVPLNMSCHDDADYDFENSSPFAQLVEELDENNNLICRHPKLQSFIVTSNLNEKFGLTSSIFTEANTEVLKDCQTLEKNKLMNFDNHMYVKENYDFKQMQEIFCSREPVLSLCNAAETNYENFTSPLLVIEEEAEKLIEKEAQDKIEAEKIEKIRKEKNSRKRKCLDQVIKTSNKKRVSDFNNTKEPEFHYALEKCFEIFTAKELEKGILCLTNKSGKIISRSKVRIPLDEKKTRQLKESIQLQFDMNDETIENAWQYIRSDLNKSIYSKKGKLQSQTIKN